MLRSVVFAAMLISPSLAFVDLVIYSYTLEKRFAVRVTKDMLQKSPRWDSEKENPPLSARKAISLANAKKDKLVKDSDDWKWRIDSASLHEVEDGRWYWMVSYDAEYQKGAFNGVPPFLRLLVLMDGTVVEPTVSDRKPR